MLESNQRIVLSLIIAYIDVEDIAKCQLVSKLWNKATKSDIVWYNLCKRNNIKGEISNEEDEINQKKEMCIANRFLLEWEFSVSLQDKMDRLEDIYLKVF